MGIIRESLFLEGDDGITIGKGITALKKSKAGRNELVAMFGGSEGIPSSIMRAKKVKVSEKTDAPTKRRSYDATCKLSLMGSKERSKLSKAEQEAYYISGRGCGAGALSTFPQNIGRTVVLLYSEPEDTIFDPFAGHNSRMDLCVKAGRNYVGCDLSTEFMEFNFKRADVLREQFPKRDIKLHHCNSQKCPVKSDMGDFTITSPPYWDIEFYGDEPEQLGKNKTYERFLGELGLVMKENFRILKPGSYAAWFINDFRRKGKMYFYHSDLIKLAESVGFVAHDIMVVDLGSGIRDCFLNQTVEQRILPKRHEYGIILRKPKE